MRKTLFCYASLALCANIGLAQQSTLIAYDNGIDKGGVMVDGQMAVRFTPASYPAELQAILFHGWDQGNCNDRMQYSVWIDPQGLNEGPVTQLIPNTEYILPIRREFEEIDISAHNLMVYSGDFYAVIVEQPSEKDLCMGFDNDSEFTARSWWSEYDTNNWRIIEPIAWLNNLPIRARVKIHTTTGTAEEAYVLPDDFVLKQNYPNPFNPSTTLSYNLPSPAEVMLSIHDLLGQEVRVLAGGAKNAGHHSVIWDGQDSNGRNVASGIYVARIVAGSFSDSRKLTLMR